MLEVCRFSNFLFPLAAELYCHSCSSCRRKRTWINLTDRAKCDAPGQISLRHLPSRRVPTWCKNLRGGSHLGRAKRSCRLADSNRASRRHPTVPNPARPLISCLEVAPRTLSARSFTKRAWAESRARTEQAQATLLASHRFRVFPFNSSEGWLRRLNKKTGLARGRGIEEIISRRLR
jgi:hypothetical protein